MSVQLNSFSTSTAVVPLSSEPASSETEPVVNETVAIKYPELPLICDSILELLKIAPSHAIAPLLVQKFNRPGCNNFLTHLLPSQILQLFNTYLTSSTYSTSQTYNILQTIQQIIRHSLFDSRYASVIQGLERDIVNYLEISDFKTVQEKVSRANTLLKALVPDDLRELGKYSMALNDIAQKIDQILNLFYYTDPDSQERITILAKEISGRDYAFPHCKQHFQRLCQNLDLVSAERAQLSLLRREIREKSSSVHDKTKSLLEAQEAEKPPQEVTEMDSARNYFFNKKMDLFWSTGTKILTKTFVNTLHYKKRHPRWTLPADFTKAMDESAKLKGSWERFSYHRSINHGRVPSYKEIDGGYIGNVWGLFTQDIEHLTDVATFMRQFLNCLSEREFQILAESKNIEEALETTFFDYFGRQADFVDLKKWALKLKPLSD